MEDLDGLFLSLIDNEQLLSSSDRGQYDKLLELVQLRVGNLLSENPDLLVSYLYRMDVNESSVQNILESGQSDIVKQLSVLILDRQIERLRTRNKYKQAPLDEWEW